MTDDPGGGSNDSGASRATRLAVNEREEVMRTWSLHRGIKKPRESRRTVQQHTGTPRLAKEIKYGTAKWVTQPRQTVASTSSKTR